MMIYRQEWGMDNLGIKLSMGIFSTQPFLFIFLHRETKPAKPVPTRARVDGSGA
jgi:hypothetical protein